LRRDDFISVMAASELRSFGDPGIHAGVSQEAWMAGSSPAMTNSNINAGTPAALRGRRARGLS
jgi:hypothetical protein